MKKTIIITGILLLLMCSSCKGQNNSSEVNNKIELHKQPEVLFEQQNINVLLEQSEDKKTYLTQVIIYTPVNLNVFWGSEMDEKEFQERKIEFSMVYRYMTESDGGVQGMVAVAYFSKDTTGYKIYGTGFLESWVWRESINHPLKPMSYEASKGKCGCFGNSDNEELLTVKVWKYVQKNWKRDE